MDDELVNTLRLARDLKNANIPIGDMCALMNMSVSEIRTIRSLMENELRYSQIREAEKGFFNNPDPSIDSKESTKIDIERQRREDDFLFRGR